MRKKPELAQAYDECRGNKRNNSGACQGRIAGVRSTEQSVLLDCMNTSFIVNPNAGGGRGLKLWNRASAYMDKRGMKYDIYFTTSPEDTCHIAGMISGAHNADKTIFVIGGDKTFSEVVNGLKHPEYVILGYIPTDARYSCAKSLRLKTDPKVLLKDYMSPAGARVETVDYGVLTAENGELTRRFINSAGIGFDAELYQGAGRHISENGTASIGVMGSIIVYRELIKTLLFSKPSKGYVLLDGSRRIEFNNLMFVSAHIHPYEYKFRFGNFADSKDGLLEMCAVSCREKLRFLDLVMKSRLGRLRSSGKARLLQCSELHIHFDRECAVHADGEILGLYTDLELRCVSGQLRIMR